MSEKTPIQHAASELYDVLSDHAEDHMEDAAYETWDGEGAWDEGADAAAMDRHYEATYRKVCAELAVIFKERSEGRFGGKSVDPAGRS